MSSIAALKIDDDARTIVAYLKAVSREGRAARLHAENVDVLAAYVEHLEHEAAQIIRVQAAVVALLSSAEGSELIEILVKLSDRRERVTRKAA